MEWCRVCWALDKQGVRWYWYIFRFECVIAWSTMRHETIIIAHSAAIRTHDIGDDTALGMTLMLIEYMKRYRVGFERTVGTLVFACACLNLHVSLLDGVRCSMTRSKLHT